MIDIRDKEVEGTGAGTPPYSIVVKKVMYQYQRQQLHNL